MKKKSAAKPSLIQIITNALDDLKAQNVVTLDVRNLTDVTDTLIIASGSSNRQVRALAQHAVDEAKKQGMPCIGIEGLDDGEWVLADFGDAVLHVMQPEIREFYDLEKLWHSPDTRIDTPVKTAPGKTAANKPTKTRTVSGKATTASESAYETQSDAAKARKAPKKPKTVTGAKKTTTGGKTAPPKAGVLAKTGTRKAASSKAAPAKSTVKKPAAAKPAAGKKATASKPVAKSATATKPAAKKPVAQKPVSKKPAAMKPTAKKPTAAAKKPAPRKPG